MLIAVFVFKRFFSQATLTIISDATAIIVE